MSEYLLSWFHDLIQAPRRQLQPYHVPGGGKNVAC